MFHVPIENFPLPIYFVMTRILFIHKNLRYIKNYIL